MPAISRFWTSIGIDRLAFAVDLGDGECGDASAIKNGRRAVLTIALLLTAFPVFAARHELPPGASVDPQTHAILVEGPHHNHKPALNLVRTDWWLSGTIDGGVARDPVLMVSVDMLGWPTIERATTESDDTLAVFVLDRRMSPTSHGLQQERVAVTLPRALADRARDKGLSLTLIGKTRPFPITVPASEITAFLDGYAAAAASATMSAPAAAPVAETPQAPPVEAPAPPASIPSAPPPTPPVAIQRHVAPRHAMPPITPEPAPDRPIIMPIPVAAPPADPPAPASSSIASPSSPPGPVESASKGIDSLGIAITATPAGAMVLSVTPGSKLAIGGLAVGDFIEGVDGKSLKGLSTNAMAVQIVKPSAKILNCMAAGDIALH